MTILPTWEYIYTRVCVAGHIEIYTLERWIIPRWGTFWSCVANIPCSSSTSVNLFSGWLLYMNTMVKTSSPQILLFFDNASAIRSTYNYPISVLFLSAEYHQYNRASRSKFDTLLNAIIVECSWNTLSLNAPYLRVLIKLRCQFLMQLDASTNHGR